jgi:hypothetical protein
MSHSALPRRVERVLESLGADEGFCDDVLGDLAEEFAVRAAWDGGRMARRWYYRESLRVAPHLLRSWWRRLGWRDVFRLTEGIVWSAIAIVAMQSVAGAFALKLADVFGIAPLRLMEVVARLQTLLFGNALMSLATGYFAASLARRARVPSALTVATFWAAFMSFAWFRYPGMAPAWFNGINLIVCFSGIAFGGVLRASREPDMVALGD